MMASDFSMLPNKSINAQLLFKPFFECVKFAFVDCVLEAWILTSDYIISPESCLHGQIWTQLLSFMCEGLLER